MNDTEMIALQARKIMKLEQENELMVVMLAAVRLQLISCGAPLNDNFLQYSKEQLKPFFKIQDICDGILD